MGRTPLPCVPRPIGPAPFTIEAAKWSYVHGRCTLDEMLEAVELLILRERDASIGIPSEMAHKVLRVPGLPPPWLPPDTGKAVRR